MLPGNANFPIKINPVTVEPLLSEQTEWDLFG